MFQPPIIPPFISHLLCRSGGCECRLLGRQEAEPNTWQTFDEDEGRLTHRVTSRGKMFLNTDVTVNLITFTLDRRCIFTH